MSTGLLDVRRLAERLDVKVSTVRAYRSRGLLPEPDEWFGRSPVWREETIEAWIASRPGQGVGGGGDPHGPFRDAVELHGITRSPLVLQHHLAAAGLALVLDAAGIPTRLAHQGLDGITVQVGATRDAVGHAIIDHAHSAAPVTDTDFTSDAGKSQPLFSSRALEITPHPTPGEVERFAAERGEVLDSLSPLNAALVAALGDPLVGIRMAQALHGRLPGGRLERWQWTSLLDMQPPQRGNTLVGQQLRPLRRFVAQLSPGEVVDQFEHGGHPSPRNAQWLGGTGDAVETWLALVGMAVMPVLMTGEAMPEGWRVGARTASTVTVDGRAWVAAPVWNGWARPARLRSLWLDTPPEVIEAVAQRDPQRVFGRWGSLAGLVLFPTEWVGPKQARVRRVLRGSFTTANSLQPTG